MDLLNMLITRNLETISHDATIRAAAEKMRDRRIGSLIVVENGREVGIISETDLARRAVADGLNPDEARVRKIMSAPIITIDIGATPEQANELMKERGIRHLVVTENGAPAGIVSVRDLLRYFKVYYDGIGSLRPGAKR
jgi:CBS domain-containing protein